MFFIENTEHMDMSCVRIGFEFYVLDGSDDYDFQWYVDGITREKDLEQDIIDTAIDNYSFSFFPISDVYINDLGDGDGEVYLYAIKEEL